MRNVFLFALMFCFLPVLATAADLDCTRLGKMTWEKVSPDEEFDRTLCSCKRVPDDATQAIIVAGKRLVVVDVSTGEVLSDGGNIDIDTGRLTPFNIDTARYWVAPGVRAFGVRVWISPYHNFYEESYEVLSLYVRKRKRIVPILDELTMQSVEDGISDDGCTDPQTCTGQMSDRRRTLEITKSATNGYFDLAVVETSRHCVGFETKVACKNSETWRKELKRTWTLRYDGVTYRTTKDVPSDVTRGW